MQKLDRGGKRARTLVCQQGHVAVVLVLGQTADTLCSNRIIGGALGKCHVPIRQHVANTVHPILSVDQATVIITRECRRSRTGRRHRVEEVLEQLCPGLFVQ